MSSPTEFHAAAAAPLSGRQAQIPSREALVDWLRDGGWLTESGWPGIDGLGLALMIGFALLGAWRGLWWQAIRLAGLVAAAWIARGLAPVVCEPIAESTASLDPRLVRGVAWLVLFLAGLAVFALLGRLGSKLLAAMQLAWVDRFGGAVAGALTGLVLHSVVVVGAQHLGDAAWAANTLGGTRSEALAEALTDRLPILLDGSAGPVGRDEPIGAPPPESTLPPTGVVR